LTGAEYITAEYGNIKEPIAKMIFAHLEDEKVLKVAELLDRHPKGKMFDFIRSERTLYEVLPKGISKAVALSKLAEILGVNKTVAIGDYNNDVEMIKAATVGVAVENACDAAKAVADVITVNHEEHAIAKIIQDIDSGKIKF
jgi:hydroxymethylpyrimidine pyrophosphatase-like HAD family hydrolase